MTEKKRLFLGVNLSIATTRRVLEAVAKMRLLAEEAGLRVAWVPPSNLHVTLKFLGWSHAEVIPAIRDQMRAATRLCSALELALQGVGSFPSERAARILWVGTKDQVPLLGQLQADLEDRMEKLGFPREDRPFSPHVTIGRIKEGADAGPILEPFRQVEFGASRIGDIVLYESLVKSSGSEYRALARVVLGESECHTPLVEESSTEGPDTHGGQST